MRATTEEGTCVQEHSQYWNESHMHINRRWYLTLVLSAGIPLPSCGVHFHRPEDATLAEKCEAVFKDTKLNETLAAESEAAAELLAEEVAAIRRHSNARRDRLLANVIGGADGLTSWGLVDRYATKRLDELIGANPDVDALEAWLAARESTDTEFETVRQAYLLYEQNRQGTDPALRICSRLTGAQSTLLRGNAQASYQSYESALVAYERTLSAAVAPANCLGLVGEISKARQNQHALLQTANVAASTIKSSIEAVKAQRDVEIAESQRPGRTADQIRNALNQAHVHTETLKGLLKSALESAQSGQLNDIAKAVEALEEARNSASNLLSKAATAVTGQAPDNSDTELGKLLASVTAIRIGVDNAEYPKTSDLLLEIEHLRIELDRQKGLIALEEERLTLYDLQLGAAAREIIALRRVQNRFAGAAPHEELSSQVYSVDRRIDVSHQASGSFTLTVNGATTQPVTLPTNAAAMENALNALNTVGTGNAKVVGTGPWSVRFGGPLQDKELAVTADSANVANGRVVVSAVNTLAAESLMLLSVSWSTGRTQLEELNYLMSGLDHRAALENAGAAFAQWNNLIGVPLARLVAYHKSGIKSEDLANLINAAGLSAIAVGVN